MNETRICNRCKKPKPLSEYYTKKNGQIYLQCISCTEVNRAGKGISGDDPRKDISMCDRCAHRKFCKKAMNTLKPFPCQDGAEWYTNPDAWRLPVNYLVGGD